MFSRVYQTTELPPHHMFKSLSEHLLEKAIMVRVDELLKNATPNTYSIYDMVGIKNHVLNFGRSVNRSLKLDRQVIYRLFEANKK